MPIIQLSDLPTDIQSNPQVELWIDGANAQAGRVAPCLASPAADAWAASMVYAAGDKAQLSGGEYLEATVAGTSAATAPEAPSLVGGTVVDGSVTWKRIASTDDQLAEARMVLVGAVSRWAAAGAGAFSQVTTGPFGVTSDTRQRGGYRLWPSEIEQLQDICGGSASGAFSVDTVGESTVHSEVCSANTYVDDNGVIVYGAAYCSCGADIAGFALYEV